MDKETVSPSPSTAPQRARKMTASFGSIAADTKGCSSTCCSQAVYICKLKLELSMQIMASLRLSLQLKVAACDV